MQEQIDTQRSIKILKTRSNQNPSCVFVSYLVADKMRITFFLLRQWNSPVRVPNKNTGHLFDVAFFLLLHNENLPRFYKMSHLCKLIACKTFVSI